MAKRFAFTFPTLPEELKQFSDLADELDKTRTELADEINDEIESLLNDDGEALDDESRALVENIARNLTEGIRQPRNALEAGIDARKTKTELVAESNLEMTERQTRNIQASFEAHLKALPRRLASRIGESQKATEFMRLGESGSAEKMTLAQFADEGQANLARQPFDRSITVPIPPSFADVADEAAKLAQMTPRERARAGLGAAIQRARK